MGLVASITSFPLRLGRPALVPGRHGAAPRYGQYESVSPGGNFFECSGRDAGAFAEVAKFGGRPAADSDFVAVLLQSFAQGLADFAGTQYRATLHVPHPSRACPRKLIASAPEATDRRVRIRQLSRFGVSPGYEGPGGGGARGQSAGQPHTHQVDQHTIDE